MTDKNELFRIADFILNKADDGDLEVIREALKRRLDRKDKSPCGIEINRLAHATGEAVEKQLSASKEQIRETVTGLVKNIIKQNAPEIGDKEMQILLDEWVPADGKKKTQPQSSALPPDVILKMIEQFLSFSNGQMSVSEQTALRESIPDWQEVYWARFSPKIRGLLTLYLKGKIDSNTCWSEIEKEIFNGKSSS